jgi:dihydroorotate dehydrogenase electron transfer subunit
MMQDARAKIIFKHSWGDYFLFRLESPQIAKKAKPGQFLMIRVNDQPYPLLRRPISIHAADNKNLEIFFQIAGRGTAILAEKTEQETLDILGPLGNGFRLDAVYRARTAFLVGGGRGIAPLYFLGIELQKLGAGVLTLYGGQSLPDIPLKEKFKESGLDILCSTDDGSHGFRGFVTGLLEAELRRRKPESLFVCGPDLMMKRTADIALRRNIPAQFSLESMMGCGFGACWGCVRRIKKDDTGEWRKICEDGPVFSAEEILWDKDSHD